MDEPEFRGLPTPRPLPAGGVDGGRLAVLERLLDHWKVLAGLFGLGVAILVASAVLLFWSDQRSTSTDVKFLVPPSLRELGQQQPQLAELLNDPALGSVYKEFVVTYETGGIAAARELAIQRGLLNDRDEIRITLVVDHPGHVPALVGELQRVGVTVEGCYKDQINVGVPMALITQLAEEQGADALFQQLTQMDHVIRLELPIRRQSDAVVFAEGEGVPITGADKWHEAGYTGRSVRVGVLDLGFDGYRGLLGSELPDDVVAASFAYGKEADGSGDVHGTACAEIVHDMAPDAELLLAFYDSTLVSMGQAVDWLLSQQVQIISNSTTGVVGPMDGSDEAAEMVDEAFRRGVLWVNSSGNSAERHYRGVFADTDGDGLHEFPDDTESMALYVGAPQVTIALNWDDWRDVAEDYDLFVFDEEGELLASSEDVQNGQPGQEAAEVLIGTNVAQEVYYVTVKGYSTTRAGVLDLYALGAVVEFPVAEHSLGSPADARGALAVGATEHHDNSLATYSSQGPSSDGRLKPELSAPAGVSSVIYAPRVFHGTSASTPHVAGAAALVWSAFPEYSAEQVREYLQSHALDLGPLGPDNAFGYGRLRLPAPPGPMTELPVVPTAMPTLPVLPTSLPQPTTVVRLPEPVEKPGEGGRALPGTTAVLLGVVAALGGLLTLGGGALLLLAVGRRAKRPVAPESLHWTGLGVREEAVQQAPRKPRPAAPPARGYGFVTGPGLPPAWLSAGVTTIGRAPGNDIVLDSVLVSRSHARIECAQGRCTVEDLDSANGLFVNDRQTSWAVISAGDELRLGDVKLVYELTIDAQPEAWLDTGTRRIAISPAGVTLGRAQTNDIHLADPRTSRHHAHIGLEQDAYVISDLDSANGTFVNGERIRRRVVCDGDEIRIGDSTFRFHRAMGS